MSILAALFAPRTVRPSRHRRRLAVERLEGRALLAAATNPMALEFSVPADVADRGVHVGIFGTLNTAYTPTSGPNSGTTIPAAKIVYLQETSGVYDFALPPPSANLPLIGLNGSSPFTLMIPPVDITSASVFFNVGAAAMELPVDAGGGVSAPTVSSNPDDVFGLFEWVYNLQEVDIDISQVDQAGLPFTAQITPPFSATITEISVPAGSGQGITVTTSAAHNLLVGDTVTISGVTSGGSPDLSFLNGTYVLPVAPTSTTFTLPPLPAAITPPHSTYTTAGSVSGFQFTAPAQNGIGMFANRDMTFAGYKAFIESLGPAATAFLETSPQNPLAPFPQNTRITAPFDVVGKLEQSSPTFIGGSGTVPAQVIPDSSGTLTGTYYYMVTAVGPTGGESMASPAQQTNEVASNAKVAVSWNPYPYAIGYHVYRSTNPSSGFMRMTDAPVAAPTVVTALKTAYTASGTTLTVTGTAGFPEAGGILVTDSTTGMSYSASYTGKTTDTFTGVGGPLPSLTTATIALLPSFIDAGATGTAATPPANNYLYDSLNQYFDTSLQDFFDYYTHNDFVLVSTATSTTWRGRVQNLSLAGHTYSVLRLTGDAAGQVGAEYAGLTANIYLPFFADNTNDASNPPAPYWLSPKTESPSSQVFGCDGAFSEPDNSQTTAAATDANGLQVKSNTSFPSSGTVTCDWVLEGTGSGTFNYSGTTVIAGHPYLQNVAAVTGATNVPAGATVTISSSTTGYENISTAPYLVVKDVMNPIATAFSRGLTPVKQAGGSFTNVIAPSLWGTNPPWLIANPVTASSSSLAAGTYYYAISAVDVNGIAGETVISPIAQATVAAGQNAMTLLFQTTSAPATATVTASTNATMLLAEVSGPWAANSPGNEKTVMVGADAYTYTNLVQLMDVTGATVNPAEQGTGYKVNDLLTIAGGTVVAGGAPATVKVTQVNASGGVEAVSIENGGIYLPTALPPAANNAATGGSGSSVQLNLGGFGNTTSSLMTLPVLAEGSYPSSGAALQIGGPTIGSYNIYRGPSPDSLALIATVPNGATLASSFLDTGISGTTPPPFRFYAPGSTANFYSAYLHRHDVSIGGLAYGFAYDDQGGFSTNIDLKRTNLMAGTSATTPLTVTITLPEWTQDIRSGDFNGDGLTDIAFRDATGVWTAELTSGTPGGPPTSVTMATWSTSENWSDIVVGNFDGDAEGTDDIAGRDSAGRWHMIAKSGGTPQSPTFTSTQIGTWSTRQTWRDVVVGDFDANGTDDIAARAGSGTWWQLHKQGASFQNSKLGNWSTRVIWTEAVAGHFTTPAGPGVRAEIAGRTSTGAWFLTSFDTSDSTWKNSRMGRWSDKVQWSDAFVGDFDGDGRDDIAARNPTNAWWAFQSDGARFASTRLGSWGTASAWSDVQVGDFLGNGFAGVAGRSSTTGDWKVTQKAGASYSTTSFAGGWSTADVWYATFAGRFDPTDTGPNKKTGLMARAVANKWVRSLSNGTTFTTTTPPDYP